MTPLSLTSSNDELLEVIHQWVRLLECEKYDEAFAMTDHVEHSGWTPAFIRQFIEGYGEAEPGQKVTLAGKPTDISQRIEVTRWDKNAHGEVGDVWYDLNINGFVSDITATFRICALPSGLVLKLEDIHVM